MHTVLIGLGMVAMTHARAVVSSQTVTLHGVCARVGAKAEAFARSCKDDLGATPKVYNTVTDIAQDAAVDFAIIATPPDARHEIVETLAAAGKPILMEKPIERDLPAAREIVTLCADRNVPLGITFQHRMRPVVATLRDLLASGDLGAVSVVEIDVPWWRDQSYYNEPGRGTYARDGGGVLINQAIHTMDLALSLLGPVASVQAFARTSNLHKMEAEDFVSAGLEFASGAIGSLRATTANYPGGAESITLHCDKARVCLISGELRIDWRDGRTEILGQAATTGGGANPMAFTHEWHQSVIEDFADALKTGRPPAITGADALQVHALIDALTRSSRTGKTAEVEHV